jgi:hypothetical protein
VQLSYTLLFNRRYIVPATRHIACAKDAKDANADLTLRAMNIAFAIPER